MAKKKKSYYKKKNKGVRYVVRALEKYFTRRYSSYSDRAARARAIVAEIRGKKQKVILQNIFSLERIPQKHPRKSVIDSVPDELSAEISDFLTESQQGPLFTPQPYWSLADYPSIIAGLDTELPIKFFSTISPSGVSPIKPGDIIGYQEYFADFVNYCNRLVKDLTEQNGGAITSDEIEYFVVCTIPDENGHSQIISTDGEGGPVDLGFDGDAPTLDPYEQPAPKRKKKTPPAESPSISPSTSTGQVTPEQIRMAELETQKEVAIAQQARAEAEKAKASAIDKALDALISGKITHAQFDVILSRL